MIACRPAQERFRFGTLHRIDRHRAMGELVGNGEHAVAHRHPVGNTGAHFVERLAQGVLQLPGAGCIRHLVDLDMDQRLELALAHTRQLAACIARHRQHGMHQHMHGQSGLGQCQAERIDQERHVVVDDLDHCVRRCPTVGLAFGIEHPDQRLAGFARLHQRI